jgi:hypothetical protein
MRHVLLVVGLLLLSWQPARAEGKGGAAAKQLGKPAAGTTRGTNASGFDYERIHGRGFTMTTYSKGGVEKARVVRYKDGSIHVSGQNYDIHNNTASGPWGLRTVIDWRAQKARTAQPLQNGKTLKSEAPITPIEVWTLPGK